MAKLVFVIKPCKFDFKMSFFSSGLFPSNSYNMLRRWKLVDFLKWFVWPIAASGLEVLTFIQVEGIYCYVCLKVEKVCFYNLMLLSSWLFSSNSCTARSSWNCKWQGLHNFCSVPTRSFVHMIKPWFCDFWRIRSRIWCEIVFYNQVTKVFVFLTIS